MLKKLYIRKIFALSLMVVFALSITPTRVLHYFFADHKDAVSIKLQESNTPQFSIAGYTCQCNSPVVISPFTTECEPNSILLPEIFVFRKSTLISSLHYSYYFFFELRGPPSLA